MRLLDRLAALTFLRIFGICLAVCPVLFIIGDVAAELDTYMARGLTGGEVARAYLYQIPRFVSWALPIAALLASVFTVHGMSAHRELVAMKSGGISFRRSVLPIVASGVLLVIFALGLAEVVPRANKAAGLILRAQTFTSTFRSDFAFRSDDGLSWQIGRLNSVDSSLYSVVTARPADEERPGLYMASEQGDWNADLGWHFRRGYIRFLNPDSTERSFQFEGLRMSHARDRPSALMEPPLEPEEMTNRELVRTAEILTRSGGDPTALMVQKEQNTSLALATLIVLLFGAPLATSNRRGGAPFGIGLSLATVVLYLLVYRFSGSLGLAGAISPAAAAWAPNALFLVAGAILLSRVRT